MSSQKGIMRVSMVLVALSMVLVLAAGFVNAAPDKLVFKLGHPLAVTHPRHLACQRFADLVKERTKGRVEIVVYPAGQLGDEIELGEAVQMGTIDFAEIGGPIFTNWVPQYAVFGLPFLFDSYQEAYKALDGPMGKKMEKLAEAKGFFILSHWDHGFRHITNNVRPIEKPSDLKGLKMRTPEEFVNIETFKALGCGVTPLPFGELYLALQQKVVDGQENPLGNIYYSKLYEVQKYLSLTSHIYANSILVTSLNTWKRIPKDIQEIMLQAADEAKGYMRELIQKDDEKLLKELKDKGMIINRPDTAPFREAVKGVYKNLEGRIGKDIIQEMLRELGK
ncbi:MAG TPA: TRAP transporter substrate-binding protein [Firmicutes bacterium]|nr:TRAP transporter substrate-binding protein [Bacillota bacterium]